MTRPALRKFLLMLMAVFFAFVEVSCVGLEGAHTAFAEPFAESLPSEKSGDDDEDVCETHESGEKAAFRCSLWPNPGYSDDADPTGAALILYNRDFFLTPLRPPNA